MELNQRSKSKKSEREKLGKSSGGTEVSIDVSQLPLDIRDKLAELELELSEGNLCSFYLYEHC